MAAADSSDVGRFQFMRKFIRSVRRTPHVHRSFFADRGSVAEGAKRAIQVDRPRFDRCIDHLARALFFHTFGQKWELEIGVASPEFYDGIASDTAIPNQPTLKTVEITRQLLGIEPIRGDNPDVFRYRLQYDGKDQSFAFAALFYDCFEVYTFSSREMSEAAV